MCPHATGEFYIENVAMYWGVLQWLGLQILALPMGVQIPTPHLTSRRKSRMFIDNSTGFSPNFTRVLFAWEKRAPR